MPEVSAHRFHNMLNCSIMSRLEDFGRLDGRLFRSQLLPFLDIEFTFV
jgi:hypothetical protein